MPRKKVAPVETKNVVGGSPGDLVKDVELETAIVDEKPTTPQDSAEATTEAKPKNKGGRPRKPRITEAEQAKIDQDKAVATMLYNMQVGLCVKAGGELWKPEEAEKIALIAAYQNMLGRFDVLPWWAEFALAQSAYFGTRIVIMQMMRAQAKKAEPAPAEVAQPGWTDQSTQTVVTPSGQLDPI